MRTIDAPRERPAPQQYHARTLTGDEIVGELHGLTLVIAVKADCDGCRLLLAAPAQAFGDIHLLFVAAESSDEPSWRLSTPPVVVSPELLRDLDVRWPPFWVLVDGDSGVVRAEGVPFGVEHVVEALTPFI